MEDSVKILVLVSGGGSNLQALIDAEKEGRLKPGRIAAVISSKAGVYAIERAKTAGVPVLVEKPDIKLPMPERRMDLSNRILSHCREIDIDLIVNAGFLSVLKGEILSEYVKKIINIHPALLPKYGGQGMYGENVHRAVLEAGEKESGCTVHYVEDGIDTGEIILQRKVPVLPDDSIESLAERILIEEHIAIVQAVNNLMGAV